MNVEVKNLIKSFNNKIAVNGVSFNMSPNLTLGLLGPNGCGKTTTIGMLLGLIKPTSGEIFIDNLNINQVNRVPLLKRINFASPYIELPKKLTVKQNLEVFGRLYEVENLDLRIEEIASELDLKKFLQKKTGELSSGQKNRVALAKSLINRPKLLLLDEPTASLDPDIGDFIRSYLEKYKRTNNVTILLASHNMSEIERLCDRVIMMRDGKIVDQGTCQELIKKQGRSDLEETLLKIARGNKL